MMLKFLEWFAVALSLAGALEMSCKQPLIGSALFLLADILFLPVCLNRKTYGMVVMYVIYSVISLVGIYEWSR
jgi:nicotinamide riboside transporter PnuC